MKLYYITFSIRGKSGLERMIVTKANYFAEHYNYEVNIITFDDYFDNNFYPLYKTITHHDLKLRGESFLSKSKRINNILKHRKPDIVLVAMDNFMATFMPLFLTKRFPIVLERHSIMIGEHQEQTSLKSKLSKKIKFVLMKIGVKSYDKLVVLSEGGIKEWGYLKNIIAINNPKTFSSEETANLNSKKVLAIGRFDYIKGFDLLLEVWQMLATKFQDWQLHIYGYGDRREEFENMITDLGIKESVVLHEPTRHIKDAYLDASIYTLSSRNEGFSLVLLEAMEFGIPIVAFDCPFGPRDIISKNEDGFLIPPGQLDDYASKLSQLMSNTELRQKMGRAGRHNIKRLEPSVIMKKWQQLFEDLVAEK